MIEHTTFFASSEQAYRGEQIRRAMQIDPAAGRRRRRAARRQQADSRPDLTA